MKTRRQKLLLFPSSRVGQTLSILGKMIEAEIEIVNYEVLQAGSLIVLCFEPGNEKTLNHLLDLTDGHVIISTKERGKP